MKGKFEVELNLLNIKTAIERHDPIAVLAVASTGIDNAEFNNHEPTCVALKFYEYSKELKSYQQSLYFEKLVKCSEESQQFAATKILNGGYNVFDNAGINYTEYVNGINVLSVEDFKQDFTKFIDGLPSNTKFVLNNTKFCLSMLDKIDCSERLKLEKDNDNVIDQTQLSREYLKFHNIIASSCKLEKLYDYIKDNAKPTVIKGLEQRLNVMFYCIERYGREVGLLNSEMEIELKETTSAYIEDMRNKGKEIYRNAPFDEKLKVLLKKGILKEEVLDRNFDCALNNLLDIFEKKNDIKGFIVMQLATTGIKADHFPLQFSAYRFDIKDNLSITPMSAISFDIRANKTALLKAKELRDSGGFDAFNYTGINYEAYMEGKRTLSNGETSDKVIVSSEDATALILKFFKDISLAEYPIITNGKATDSEKSFTQTHLSKIGNIPMLEAPYIDFAQIMKEYAFRSYVDTNFPDNVLFNPREFDTGFELLSVWQSFAQSSNGNEDIRHTENKCRAMATLLRKISMSYLEFVRNQQQTLAEQSKSVEVQAVEDDVETISETYETVEPINPAVSEIPEKQSISIEGAGVKKLLPTNEETYIPVGNSNFSNYFTEDGYDEMLHDSSYTDVYEALSNSDPNNIDTTFANNLAEGVSNAIETANEVVNTVEDFADELNDIPNHIISSVDYDNFADYEDYVDLSGQSNTTSNVTEQPVFESPFGAVPSHSKEIEEPKPSVTPVRSAQSSTPIQQNAEGDVALSIIAAINAQTDAIKEQNALIAEQNSLMKDQKRSLFTVLGRQSDIITQTIELAINMSGNKELDIGRGENTITDKLELLKEQIGNIASEIHNAGAKMNLYEANSYITKGQASLERNENEIEKKQSE